MLYFLSCRGRRPLAVSFKIKNNGGRGDALPYKAHIVWCAEIDLFKASHFGRGFKRLYLFSVGFACALKSAPSMRIRRKINAKTDKIIIARDKKACYNVKKTSTEKDDEQNRQNDNFGRGATQSV